MKAPAFGRCKGCGAPIVWIESYNGRMIPCDATLIQFVVTPGGSLKIVQQNGCVVSAEREDDPEKMDGVGYTSHFSTCPMAAKFRKAKK